MKKIDLSKDEIEEMYWTNTNKEMADILGIDKGEITLLISIHGIESKQNLKYGHQYSEAELSARRSVILKKIADRNPVPVVEKSRIEKLNIAVKGLEEILEISDNAYVLELVHNTLKKLKQ